MVPTKHCATKDNTLSLVRSFSVSRALFLLIPNTCTCTFKETTVPFEYKCSKKQHANNTKKMTLYNVKEIFPTISLLKWTIKKRSQYCALQPSINTIGLADSLSGLITQGHRRWGHPSPLSKVGHKWVCPPHTHTSIFLVRFSRQLISINIFQNFSISFFNWFTI